MLTSRKTSKHRRIRSWLLIAAIFISQQSFSDISIIASELDKQRPLYNSLREAINELPNSKRYDIAVTIGQSSLDSTLKRKHSYDAVIAIGATRYDFNLAITSHPEKNYPVSAIYAEPPPDKIVKLARLIYGENSRLLIPFHSKKQKELIFTKEILEDKHITVLPSKNSRWVRRLRDYDAAIAIADIQLYSNSNLNAIGRSLYRQRKGFFGFSSELVTENGALASLYTKDIHLIKQLVGVISLYIEKKTLAPPDQPDHYSIEIKSQLAKTLGFYALDIKTLETEINKIDSKEHIE